jgi:predicted nucleotide-binding protein (sugar kinase/HSP70/actin superfamily)
MNGEQLKSAWERFQEKMKSLRQKQKEILERFSKRGEEAKLNELRDQLKKD